MDWLVNELAAGLSFLGQEAGHLLSVDWYRENGIALLNIIMIDLVLAGDNAIVVGMAAARVAPEMRAKVIFWGITAAVLLRIAFAAITDICRASRLATILPAAAMYFLKCSVSRCALNAASLS